MSNPVHVEILMQGVEVWNAWRKQNPSVHPDLSGIGLEGRIGIEPPRGNLSLADFCNTDLTGAKLYNLNISGANLRNVKAQNADFRLSNFRRSKMDGADLRNTTLNGAVLERATLH